MQTMNSNQSEISYLREQIEAQLVAMRRGLSGLSSGSARHTFITARMDRIGACHNQLSGCVGEKAASSIVYGMYNEIMDAPDL